MRNSFAFCLQRVALYSKGMSNSIGFYKKIFLHAIPAHIIVPFKNETESKMENSAHSFREKPSASAHIRIAN